MEVATVGILKEIRRVSDPDKAQIIWDGIKTVRAQKQIPALPRLSRYMNRNYKLDKDTTQRLLDLAVEDNLVKLHKKVGTKGNKAGVEEDAYRLPTEDMLPYERHDWYCFHCHAGGEVVMCRDCHRVYHQSCLKQEVNEQTGFICQFCSFFQTISAEYSKAERADLNMLLQVTTNRLREKMPSSILTRQPPPPAKNPFLTSDRKATIGEGGEINSADREAFASFGEEKWRAKFLLKRQIDLEEVLVKCQTQQYRVVEEYKADVQNIVHNVVIYHGVHSKMADCARLMFRDCAIDLTEMVTCRDCYRYANTRGDKHWFAKPCRPFHEIVYAKQKGFPYWPAKVVNNKENSDGQVEVRFFGGYHRKALVERHHIKPISTNVHSLQIKRTSEWNKASEELKRYQELHDKYKDKPEFLTDQYGDPFDGEKVSQLTTGFGEESESESEEEQCREPGEPGTSLPNLELSLSLSSALTQPILVPVTPGMPGMHRPLTANNRPPTKLRRIEPKPMAGLSIPTSMPTVGIEQQSPVMQQNQQQTAMMVPLTVVTVPQMQQQLQLQLQQQQQQQLHMQQQQQQVAVPAQQLTPQLMVEQVVQQQEAAAPVVAAAAALPVETGEGGGGSGQQSQQSPSLQRREEKKESRRAAKAEANRDEQVREVKEEAEGEDAVSSSSQLARFVNASVQTPNKLLRMVAEEICGQSARKPHAERDFKEYAEKLRAEFEQEKKRAVNVATRSLERDLERLKADHATEVENLTEKYRGEISDNKKKQWCYNCESEAIYWCCWNAAYCSTECQQNHWHREHKKSCRRKR